MNAMQTATLQLIPSSPTTQRVLGIGLLRALLLGEAALSVVLTIVLSMLASVLNESLGGALGRSAEQAVRFAAGFSLLFAISAAVASRGARLHRGWSWTLTALLQLVLAIGAGIVVVSAIWHPAYLLGFALSSAVMLVLSTPSVRRALGQT